MLETVVQAGKDTAHNQDHYPDLHISHGSCEYRAERDVHSHRDERSRKYLSNDIERYGTNYSDSDSQRHRGGR